MKNTIKICNLQEFAALPLNGKKVGILGGSFNPPHEGHLAICRKALELGLDYILVLVAPQNPLKPKYELGLDKRVTLTAELTQEKGNIIVSALEQELHTNNTYDTLQYLTSNFQEINFVWIMGVDCLKEFHLWENYDKFLNIVDIIIFNRDNYENLLKESPAGKLFFSETKNLYNHNILFVREKLSNLSSTEIRKNSLRT